MYLLIDGAKSTDYNLKLKGYPSLPVPVEVADEYDIVGYSGTKVKRRGRYEDLTFSCTFVVDGDSDLDKQATYNAYREYLLNHQASNLYIIDDSPFSVGQSEFSYIQDGIIKNATEQHYALTDHALTDVDKTTTEEEVYACASSLKSAYSSLVAENNGSHHAYRIKHVRIGAYSPYSFAQGEFDVEFILADESIHNPAINPVEVYTVDEVLKGTLICEECTLDATEGGSWRLYVKAPLIAENRAMITEAVKKGAIIRVKTWQTDRQMYRLVSYTKGTKYVELNCDPIFYDTKNIFFNDYKQNGNKFLYKEGTGYSEEPWDDDGIDEEFIEGEGLIVAFKASDTYKVYDERNSVMNISAYSQLAPCDSFFSMYEYLVDNEGNSVADEYIRTNSVVEGYHFNNKRMEFKSAASSVINVRVGENIIEDGISIYCDWSEKVDAVYPVGHEYGARYQLMGYPAYLSGRVYDGGSAYYKRIPDELLNTYMIRGLSNKSARYQFKGMCATSGRPKCGERQVSTGADLPQYDPQIKGGKYVRLVCDDVYLLADAIAFGELDAYDTKRNSDMYDLMKTEYAKVGDGDNTIYGMKIENMLAYRFKSAPLQNGYMYQTIAGFNNALTKKAKAYYEAHKRPDMKITIDCSAVDEEIKLGSNVSVTYPEMNLDGDQFRVTSIKWDCIEGRALEISLGNTTQSFYKF